MKLRPAAVLCTLTACVPSLQAPEGASIACEIDADCPPNYVCNDVLGRCFEAADREAVAPGVVGASVEIVPARATTGVRVTIRFTTDEPLARNPAVFLTDPSGALPNIDGESAPHLEGSEERDGGQMRYTFGFTPTGAEAGIAWRVAASLVDRGGNLNPESTIGTLILDFEPPRVEGDATATPVLLRDGVMATVRVPVSELLAAPPRVTLFWPDGQSLERLLTPDDVDATNLVYVATYTAQGDEPQRPGDLRIEMTDLASNAAVVVVGEVLSFDLTGPEVVAVSGPTITAPPDSPLSDVQHLAAGAVYALEITAGEILPEAPRVRLERADLPLDVPASFTPVGAAGSTYRYRYTVLPGVAYPEGAYAIVAELSDVAGNVTHVELDALRPGFVIDLTPPPTPDTESLAHIVHRRVPWGSTTTANVPRFELRGGADPGLECPATSPGGIECSCAGVPCTCACTWIFAYGGAVADRAAELGRVALADDGSFAQLVLPEVDRADVWVAAVDAAGNLSDRDPFTAAHEGAMVRDGEWVATFGAKIGGDGVQNPHELLATSSFQASLVQRPGTTREPQLLPSIGAVVGELGGPMLTVDAERLWEERVLTNNHPTARTHHAVAYDGARARLVLFGGEDASGPLGDTWEWDGVRWIQIIPASGQPAARSGHSMVYDAARGEVLLFGGRANSTRLGDTWSWDGTVWRSVTPPPAAGAAPPTSPEPRFQAAVVYDVARARVVLFGGVTSAPESDVWEWDGSRWWEIEPLVLDDGVPEPRNHPALAYVGPGDVRLYGGGSNAATRFDMWTWDGTSWTSAGDVPGPDPSLEKTMAYDALREQLVLVGNATYRFNGSSWVRAAITVQPVVRDGGTLVFDAAAGELVLFGGLAPEGDCEGTGAAYCGDIWSWNGSRWVELSPLIATSPPPRDQHAMTYVTDAGVSLMFGGANGLGLSGTWTWTGANWIDVSPAPPASEPSKRVRPMMAYDEGRRVAVLFGGIDFDDPGCAVQAGNTCADTWEWGEDTSCPDGTRCWRNVTPSSDPAQSPPSRFGGALAYHADAGLTVLYGGDRGTGGDCNIAGSNICSDTWVWDGAVWTEVGDGGPDSPGPRSRHDMTYDSTGRRLVLFGGIDGDPEPDCAGATDTSASCADTWVWGRWVTCAPIGGRCWRELTPGGERPAARHSHALAFAPARNRVVLFGGQTGSAAQDTWELNGLAWHEITAKHSLPPARFAHAMVHDAARGRTVLFGGAGLRDTWELESDPDQTPAAIATIDWRFAAVAADAVTALRVSAMAGGRGYSTVPLGDGVAADGAQLVMWEPGRLRWSVLAAAPSASPEVPAPLDYLAADAAAARALLGNDNRFHIAVRPTAPQGNGADAARVSLDYVELDVSYRR